MSSNNRTRGKNSQVPKTQGPAVKYKESRDRGPAFSPARSSNPMLGAIESGGMHPRTGLFQRVRHYTERAAIKRRDDLIRKGWTQCYVLDTKRPVEVKLGLPQEIETRLERAQAERAMPSLTGFSE